jgi:hypothetical protein
MKITTEKRHQVLIANPEIDPDLRQYSEDAQPKFQAMKCPSAIGRAINLKEVRMPQSILSMRMIIVWLFPKQGWVNN